MASKKKILVLVDWYLPGYKAGGPIVSIVNIIDYLKKEFNFKVITSDTDSGAAKPYPEINGNTWNTLMDNTEVFYIKKAQSFLKKIAILKKQLRANKDAVIYLNSLFSIYFTLIPLLIYRFSNSPKIILAPRGMLGKGALDIKPVKKKLFIFVAKWTGLYKKVQWHASTDQEKKEIHAAFGNRANVNIAINPPTKPPDFLYQKEKKPGTVSFVFLSRVYEKKNPLMILKLLRQVKNYQSITFDLYGPINNAAYWQKCKDVIKQLPPNIMVNLKDPIPSHKVHAVLMQYHFFVLPTLHENFGHAIYEALSVGCPVIISDQTPWRNLIAQQAGWDIPLNKSNNYIKVIEKCIQMDSETYNSWSQNAFNHAQNFLKESDVIKQNLNLFKGA